MAKLDNSLQIESRKRKFRASEKNWKDLKYCFCL